MDYRRKGQILCVRWKDKRDVNMLTTVHLPDMRRVCTRAQGEKQKPECNIDYTSYMSGVDHSDQMVSCVPLHRKTVKRWKKLAFHLITLAMVQAHCLYNKYRLHKKISPVDFAISVSQTLADLSAARLTGRHFPESLGGTSRRNTVLCVFQKWKSKALLQKIGKTRGKPHTSNARLARLPCV